MGCGLTSLLICLLSCVIIPLRLPQLPRDDTEFRKGGGGGLWRAHKQGFYHFLKFSGLVGGS